MEQYNNQAYDKWDTEALIACPHCARTFLPDRLEIHLRSCTKERPLKARVVGPTQSKTEPSKHQPQNQHSSPYEMIQPKGQNQQIPSSKPFAKKSGHGDDSILDMGGSSGGTRGKLIQTNKPQSTSKPQISAAFLKSAAHVKDGNLMFTLDEEDTETEYGESFKSSTNKSTANFQTNKNHHRDITSSEDEDDDDDDDLDPDQDYKRDRGGDFDDEDIYYQAATKHTPPQKQYPNNSNIKQSSYKAPTPADHATGNQKDTRIEC